MSTDDFHFSGERFRLLRSVRKVTLQDVADALNVSKTSVHQWESGKSFPTPNNFRELASFLKVEELELTERGAMFNEAIRAITKDEEGRNQHETDLDPKGNVTKHHYTIPFSPGLWSRLHKSMEQAGYTENDVDAYLQSLIAEDYRKRFLVPTPENQLTEDSGKAN